jgi:zinc and cadmium transporter
MLGVALLHLLPHAMMAVPASTAVGWLVAGLLAMFFLERFFSYHHHTAPGDAGLPPITADPEPDGLRCEEAPGDPIDHPHGHQHTPFTHSHSHPRAETTKLSWAGVGAGLTIHSLINGAALAAAVAAESHLASDSTTTWARLPGLAVFLVVAMHKPFDSMTLLTLMTSSGLSAKARVVVNVAYACCVPIGAAFFALGLHSLDLHTTALPGYALAFTAGMFLCIALADLLPEVQFHHHDKLLLSAAMLLGLGLAWTINALESTVHDHNNEQSHNTHDH